MTGEMLTLDGCTPTPLASYLKALGVLRLISSPANHVSGVAADPYARGWWENERFHLRTTTSRNALARFFLHDYAPSPIIAPWNGRAGFLEGDTGETSNRAGAVLMNKIGASTCHRLKSMQDTIRLLRNSHRLQKYNGLRAKAKALKDRSKKLTGDAKKVNDTEQRRVEKEAQTLKSLLLPSLRSETEQHHVSYIDACYVLAADEAAAPILGSGGNDGSRDFGVNFAKHIEDLIDFENGGPVETAGTELDSALFDIGYRADRHGSMGQFSPGQSGPNATTGYVGRNPLNSWDVVLAMEGTLVFAGALSRRWGAAGGSRGAFPFTFDPSNAGAGSLSSEDPNRPRGEVWTPLWSKPAAPAEIEAIFAEGRLTVGQRTARTGLDAARSVARLGVSRGIEGFERYSIIQPDSKMPYQATPLGRFDAPDQPRRDLTADLEAGDWLERGRSVGNRKTSPAHARQAMRRFEDALFQMASPNRRRDGIQKALTALGSFVGWLATNKKIRGDLAPPPPLSPHWLREADDGSAEFRIAAALAGLGLPAPVHPASTESGAASDGGGRPEAVSSPLAAETPSGETARMRSCAPPPMAAHLAPLDEKRFHDRGRLGNHRAWSDGDAPPTVVWGAGPLVPNMIAVLGRRLVEAPIRGLEEKPLAGAFGARLTDVAAFLFGNFDDARCAALLAGLVWARPIRLRSMGAQPGASPVPFAYAALKPIFTPDATLRSAVSGTARMPIPPGLVARLRAGGGSRDGRAADAAVRMALARAHASGLPTRFRASRTTTAGSSRMGAGVAADRLAAALLIPISDWALKTLIRRAYPGALPEDDDVATEEMTNET